MMIEKYFLKEGYDDTDAEVIAFGLKKLGLLVINIFGSLGIGYYFGCTKGMLWFLMLYFPLRVYAGGFHMNRLWKCEILSTGIVVIIAILLNCDFLTIIAPEIRIIILLVEGVFFFIFAPQDSENKKLYVQEKRRYRIISLTLCATYETVYFIVNYISKSGSLREGASLIESGIILAMMVSSISLLESAIWKEIAKKD